MSRIGLRCVAVSAEPSCVGQRPPTAPEQRVARWTHLKNESETFAGVLTKGCMTGTAGAAPGNGEDETKMIRNHIDEKRIAPAWAIVGAPLVGIPVLVALLALASPGTPATDQDTGSVVSSEYVGEAAAPVDEAGAQPADWSPEQGADSSILEG